MTLPTFRKRPTQRELLMVIGRCQDLLGSIKGTYLNDRAVDRSRPVQELCDAGFDMCVDTLGFFPPGPSWGDTSSGTAPLQRATQTKVAEDAKKSDPGGTL